MSPVLLRDPDEFIDSRRYYGRAANPYIQICPPWSVPVWGLVSSIHRQPQTSTPSLPHFRHETLHYWKIDVFRFLINTICILNILTDEMYCYHNGRTARPTSSEAVDFNNTEQCDITMQR